jgi:hypothetical protein
MKTLKQLNTDILQITMLIKDKYPELSKYLLEIHETIPDEIHPKIKRKTL